MLAFALLLVPQGLASGRHANGPTIERFVVHGVYTREQRSQLVREGYSYGDLVLYPYGYTYTDLPPDMTALDRDTFVAMGAEIQRTTGYHA